MYKVLEKLDIFGHKLSMMINSKSSQTTSFGGTLTLLMAVLIIIATWFLGNDIIYKKEPISFSQKNISTVYDDVNVNNSTMPIAVTLSDYNSNPIWDERYIRLEMYERALILNEGETKVEVNQIEMVKCTREHFPGINNETLESNRFNLLLCPPLGHNSRIKGFFSESEMRYVQFRVKMCNYEDPTQGCGSREEIIEFIEKNQIHFKLFYFNNFPILNNNDNPIGSSMEYYYNFLNPDFNFLIVDNVQKNYISTDNGFFLKDVKESIFLTLYRATSHMLKVDLSEKILIDYHLFATNKSELFYRKYVKVTEIMASVGGLLKLLMMVFSIISFPISKTKMFVTLIEKLFKYSKKDEIPNVVNKSGSTSKNNFLKDIIAESPIKEITRPQKPINFQNLKKIDYFYLSVTTLMKKILCSNKRLKNLNEFYLQCMNVCIDNLNVNKMIENNIRNKTFIELLLTKEQVKSFNNLNFRIDPLEDNFYNYPDIPDNSERNAIIDLKLRNLLNSN